MTLSTQNAGVAVAAVVLLPFLIRWLWLLRARHDRLTETQQQLADALQVAPGVSYRDLQRILDAPNGVVNWNLRALERRRLVAVRDYKNTKRYFWGTAPPDWKRVVVTQRKELQSLIDWARARDAFTQAEAATAAGLGRSTVQNWLADLVDAGLLHTHKDGRRRMYRSLAPVEAPNLNRPMATLPIAVE